MNRADIIATISQLKIAKHIHELEYDSLEYELMASARNYPGAQPDIITYTQAERLKGEIAILNNDLEFLSSLVDTGTLE